MDRTDLDRRLADLRAKRAAMTPVELVADVESRHFRTGHDSGAAPGVLFIWNIVREYAGLEPITRDDLIQRHADELGMTLDEMRKDYAALAEVQRLVKNGMTYAQAFEEVDK